MIVQLMRSCFFLQNVSISKKERDCYMDLRPFMNPSPYTVHEVSSIFLNTVVVFRTFAV